VYSQVRDEFTTLRNSISQSNIEGILSSANIIRSACTPFTGQQQELYRMDELAPEILSAYEYNHYNPGLTGVPTGWPYLDEQTGGWQNGDFIVWVARPGVGKTWLSIHQAITAWTSGKSVLYVSMEMTLKQIGTRIASYLASLNPDLTRKGLLSNWGRERFYEAIRIMREARNFHLYAGNFKKNTASVEALIQELNPDLVIIDGMYLMSPANKSRVGRFEAAAYLMDELKRMCLMTERPLVATTQFGRKAGKGGKDGSLENIGYTDAIGTHASVILAAKLGKVRSIPVRSEELDHATGEYRSRISGYKKVYPHRHIELMKGREGESGEFGTCFSFSPTNFSEVSIQEAVGEEAIDEEPDLEYMR